MNTIVRHRARQRFTFGWVAGLTCLAVAIAIGAYFVYSRYGQGCQGTPVGLTVVASPDQVAIMSKIAREWDGKPSTVEGRCVGEIAVRGIDSATVAASLGADWDTGAMGSKPDVWAPDASSWLLVAAARPEADKLIPRPAQPSIASSAVVLAVRRPMAEALGWPAKPLGWSDLLTQFVGGQTWAKFGHPEWGPMRLSMADPTRSTAGLDAVLTALDLDADNTMSSQEILGGVTFSQLVTSVVDSDSALLASATVEPVPGAFPVLERTLAAYLKDNPQAPLVPVYPTEGIAYADYPYVTLSAPWVDKARTQLATLFLKELQSQRSRLAYASAGFRDATRTLAPNDLTTVERGFRVSPAVPVRRPSMDSLGQLLGMWAVLNRTNNVLVALDTSGSMADPVPGTGFTRLQMMQRAAIQGISLLNNQSVIGLWQFSTDLTPTTDYRELVPVGRSGDMLGEYTRRQVMAGAVQGLQAKGDTGLYDTILAAYRSMQNSWQPSAQNVLVIITDGRNDDPKGMSLDQLTTKLKAAIRPDKPLTVIGIAVGTEADAGALDTVTKLTGGRTLVARDDVSAIQQVVLAFAGRIS